MTGGRQTKPPDAESTLHMRSSAPSSPSLGTEAGGAPAVPLDERCDTVFDQRGPSDSGGATPCEPATSGRETPCGQEKRPGKGSRAKAKKKNKLTTGPKQIKTFSRNKKMGSTSDAVSVLHGEDTSQENLLTPSSAKGLVEISQVKASNTQFRTMAGGQKAGERLESKASMPNPKSPDDENVTTEMDQEDVAADLIRDMGDWATLLEPEDTTLTATRTMAAAVPEGKQTIQLDKPHCLPQSTFKPSPEPTATGNAGGQKVKCKNAKKRSKNATEVFQVGAEGQQKQEGTVIALSHQISSMELEGGESKKKRGKPVDPDLSPGLTSGEMEKLFWGNLERGLPRHFSTKHVKTIRVNGSGRISNPFVLVLDSPRDTSYAGLFGKITKEGVYEYGPIVSALDDMVPFLKKAPGRAIRKARECLREAYLIRRKELREQSPSYQSHLYMVHVMKGTLDYLDELVEWLSRPDADPWIPRRERRNGAGR